MRGYGTKERNIVGNLFLMTSVPYLTLRRMHDFIEFHAEDSGAQDVTYGIGTIKDKRIETGGMTF